MAARRVENELARPPVISSPPATGQRSEASAGDLAVEANVVAQKNSRLGDGVILRGAAEHMRLRSHGVCVMVCVRSLRLKPWQRP